jgi:hypothetical protein
MKTTALAVIVSLLALSAGNVFAQEAAQWRKVADAIPLGTAVKVQRVNGSRISGTLMRADDTAITLKRNTRVPEAPVSIGYDQIANMERERNGGMGWGKAIGMGIGAGAGAILTIFVIALQWD